jgi:hypothetical protein
MAEKEYIVVAPDGKEITIIGPEGASQSEIITQAQRLYKTKSEPTVTISEATINPQFAETSGGAAVGRPTRNLAQVQPEPRPLESALVGGFKGAVVDPILGASKLLTGGNVGQEASQSMAQQAKPYQQANPGSYLGGNIVGSVMPAAAMMKGASLLPSLAKLPEFGQALATMGGTGVLSGLISPEETGKTGQDFYKEQAKQGAISGGIGSVIPFASKLASLLRSNPQTPQMVEAIQKAREMGYVIPPTQANSTLLNKALEGSSGKISTAQNASAKNQEVTNKLAAKSLGLPEETVISPELLTSIRNTAGDAYKSLEVLPIKPEIPRSFMMNQPYVPEINPKKMVYDLRIARNEADAYYKAYGRSADPEQLTKAKLAKNKANELETQLEDYAKSLGKDELLPKLKEARQLIAKTYSVEKALNPASGTIEASKLAAQLTAKKPLSGELKDIAEFNLRYPKASQTTEKMGSLPQISPLDVALATGVGATSYFSDNGSPTAGAIGSLLLRPAARSMALSPMIQNRLIQQPSKSNELAKLLMMQGATKAITGE